MAIVKVSSPLRRFIGKRNELIIEGETVFDVISTLADQFPRMGDKLLRGASLSMQTIISVDQMDIRLLDNENTLVGESSVIHLLPALVGG